jgi:hypothetical protein
MSKFMGIVFVVTILMVTLAGCSGDAAATADRQEKVCESITALKGSTSSFVSADTNTKVADLKQLKTKLDGPIQLIETANGVLKLSQIDAMLTSYADFSQTVDGLNSETLGAEAAKVQTGVEALDVALGVVSAALKCSQE